MSNEIRQGEVLLVPVSENKVPAGYVKTVCSRALLAHGETENTHTVVAERATGGSISWLHDAAVDIGRVNEVGAATLIETSRKAMFVWVDGSAQVVHSDQHQGHAPAPLAEGYYRIMVKREQHPWEAESRFVAD